MAKRIRNLLRRDLIYAVLCYGCMGFSLLASMLFHPSPASAETLPICEVSGVVGVPFSPNLAVACANDSSITVCSLAGGTLPLAPGITTLAGCVISGTPAQAGVFRGTYFKSVRWIMNLRSTSAGASPGTVRLGTLQRLRGRYHYRPRRVTFLWRPESGLPRTRLVTSTSFQTEISSLRWTVPETNYGRRQRECRLHWGWRPCYQRLV